MVMWGSLSPVANGGGYTASGSGSTFTNAGVQVLSVNGATTVDGASTLTGTVKIGGASKSTGTVKIGGGYTNSGTGATITDAGVLSINGAATVDGSQPRAAQWQLVVDAPALELTRLSRTLESSV